MRGTRKTKGEVTTKGRVGVDYGTGTDRDYRINIMKVDENGYLVGQQSNI